MSFPVGKKACAFFWCMHHDCRSYNTGKDCGRCNANGTCGNCILFVPGDGGRPYSCSSRRDQIQLVLSSYSGE